MLGTEDVFGLWHPADDDRDTRVDDQHLEPLRGLGHHLGPVTDTAAERTRNGLAFAVIAADSTGKKHTLVQETLMPGDTEIHHGEWYPKFPIHKLKFVGDSLGNESWDELWVHPEIVPADARRQPSGDEDKAVDDKAETDRPETEAQE